LFGAEILARCIRSRGQHRNAEAVPVVELFERIGQCAHVLDALIERLGLAAD